MWEGPCLAVSGGKDEMARRRDRCISATRRRLSETAVTLTLTLLKPSYNPVKRGWRLEAGLAARRGAEGGILSGGGV